MAQLRQDYQQFLAREAEVLMVGPDGPRAFQRYWKQEEMPFVGMADVGSKIADMFFQEFNLLKLGRMPALFVVDKQGFIRFKHYGKSIADIPENDEVIKVLDQINKKVLKNE
jgi:peroxiredoxin